MRRGENLRRYKRNKLQHEKCFVRYLSRSCFCIRKFTRSLPSLLLRKFRTRYISSPVKILMTSLISCLTLKLYLNLLVYDRINFRSSSKVFGNLRLSSKIFGNLSENVRKRFLENLRKSSESGRKSLQNRQYNKHSYAWLLLDVEYLFSC